MHTDILAEDYLVIYPLSIATLFETETLFLKRFKQNSDHIKNHLKEIQCLQNQFNF